LGEGRVAAEAGRILGSRAPGSGFPTLHDYTQRPLFLRSFPLVLREERAGMSETSARAVPLVEDNPADISLIRKAIEVCDP
jgi:hypothetical protein